MASISPEPVKPDMVSCRVHGRLEEFDLAKGVTFLHGYFENKIVVDRFQVFRNGMLV